MKNDKLLGEILEKFVRTRMDDRGRVYIPKQIRRKLRLKEGDVLYITFEGDTIRLLTVSTIKKGLKGITHHSR